MRHGKMNGAQNIRIKQAAIVPAAPGSQPLSRGNEYQADSIILPENPLLINQFVE